MKKIATTIGLALTLASSVYAGGPTYEPTQPMEFHHTTLAADNWTGLYLGINGGYGWQRVNTRFLPLPNPTMFNAENTSIGTNMSGGIYGAQLGYDWQLGNNKYVVLGIATNFEGSLMTGSSHGDALFAGGTLPGALYAKRGIDWIGSVRPIIGALSEDRDWLFYITGGFAYADITASGNADFRPADTHQYPVSINTIQTGWVGGGGLEWRFAHNLSCGAQYLYYGLDDATSNVNAVPFDNAPLQMSYRFETETSIATLDFNYRFA